MATERTTTRTSHSGRLVQNPASQQSPVQTSLATQISQLSTPSTRDMDATLQQVSADIESRSMHPGPSHSRDSSMEELSSWRAQHPTSSSSSTHLLTPHSPTNNFAYVAARGDVSSPSFPITKTQSHPPLGSAISTRVVDSQNSVQSSDSLQSHGSRYERKHQSFSSSQLTPTSRYEGREKVEPLLSSKPRTPRSPIYTTSSRHEPPKSSVSPDHDSTTNSPYSPRHLQNASSPRLSPSHVVNRSRSDPDLFETPTSSSNKLGNSASSTQATPLLPAFEENVDSPRSSRSTRRSSPSPVRFSSSAPSLLHSSQGFSRPSSRQTSRVEDVVDHVFRVNTPTKNLSNATTVSSRHSTPMRQQAHPQTPPPAGVVSRLRSETLAERRVRSSDSARRRPEYLKRVSSQKKNAGVAVVEAEPPDPHPSEGQQGLSLGIAFSPVKGRRIQLVRPSSPSTASQASPRSPHFPQTSSMSNLTLQWLQSSPLTPLNERPKHLDEEEKESRKRRRLAAFLHDKSPRMSPLKPVEVTGMGRVAIHPDDITEVFVSPAKKSAKKKGSRRAAPTPAPVKRTTIFGLEVREDPLHPLRSSPLPSKSDDKDMAETPEWPERTFPWSSSVPQAVDLKAVAMNQRLRHLEEFFDRATDDEDSDELEGETRSPVDLRADRSPSTPPHLGNGKSILTEPEPSLLVRSISTFSDPGDARTAFFAKHRVRTIATRVVREQSPDNGNASEEEDDDGAINCVCGRDNVETPMVRCDSCNNWSHQECVGIVDESQLEGEWFCYNCEQRMISDANREPTFTLTSESPRPRAIASVKFYEPPPASPLIPPPPRAHDPVPTTPKGASASNGLSTPFSRTKPAAWDLGNVVGPSSLRTPRTPLTQRPMDMRMYSTPKFFSEYDPGSPLQDAFDPTSTPSRGIQFGTPFRDLGASGSRGPWSNQFGQPPTTPTNRSHGNRTRSTPPNEGGSGSATDDSPGTSTSRSMAFFLNDTPTRSNDSRSRHDLQSPLSTPYTSSPSLGSFEGLDLHSSERKYTSISSMRSDPSDASPALATFKGKAKAVASVVPNESAVRTGSGSDEDRY